MATSKGGAWAIWFLLVWGVACGKGGAPVGAPTPSVDCTSALLNLADCLTFVEAGSKVAKPEGQCCSGLKKVVKQDVACLCEAFKSSSNFGVALNVTKALILPHACGVSTPPISRCHISVAGVPAASPAPSTGFSSALSPATGKFPGVPAPSPRQSSVATASPVPILAILVSVSMTICTLLRA